jgi:uncharacterized protein (DUF2147 family)
MRKVYLTAVLFAFTCSMASAADPAGEWLVKDGNARILIERCANGLWGFISWVRVPATDRNNPASAKQTRSIVGVAIVRGMSAVKPNRWEGEVYNADNGKMYSASITMTNDDVLRIEGCVLGGLFCGGESWTRVEPAVERKPANSASKSKEGTAVPLKTCYDR